MKIWQAKRAVLLLASVLPLLAEDGTLGAAVVENAGVEHNETTATERKITLSYMNNSTTTSGNTSIMSSNNGTITMTTAIQNEDSLMNNNTVSNDENDCGEEGDDDDDEHLLLPQEGGGDVVRGAEAIHDDSLSKLPDLYLGHQRQDDGVVVDEDDDEAVVGGYNDASEQEQEIEDDLNAPEEIIERPQGEGPPPDPVPTNHDDDERKEIDDLVENTLGDDSSKETQAVSEEEDNLGDGVVPTEIISDDDAETVKEEAEAVVVHDEEEHPSSLPECETNKGITKTTPSLSTVVDKGEEEEISHISERVVVDYASKSAGALILEKSPDFMGTSNLLNGDKDKYAISPCAEKKFFVLSLSEDIQVKQVKVANYELYSSRIKEFQLLGSQTMGDWVDLGTYSLTPTRGVQTFDLLEPSWARYLKFGLLSHHGDEHYCTISRIMVHGNTMVQGFHEQWEESEKDEEDLPDAIEETMMSNQESSVYDTIDNNEGESDVISSGHDRDVQLNAAAAKILEKIDSLGGETLVSGSEDSDPKIDPGETVHVSSQKNTEREIAGRDSYESLDPPKETQRSDTKSGVAAKGEDTANNASSSENRGSKSEGRPEFRRQDSSSDENIVNRTFESYLFSSSSTNSDGKSGLITASIGLSSNALSTIMGSLEPLDLRSIIGFNSLSKRKTDSTELSTMKLVDVLAKSSRSDYSLRYTSMDPNLVKFLTEKSEDGSGLGLSLLGNENTLLGNTLTEKIARDIIQQQQQQRQRTPKQELGANDSQSSTQEKVKNTDKERAPPNTKNTVGQDPSSNTGGTIKRKPASDSRDDQSTKFDSLHDTDLALAQMLDKIPSAVCLKGLDFPKFKAGIVAARKGAAGSGGSTASGNSMEPIFKKLTDEIKSLQLGLSVHDQFTKAAVTCYQKVLMDVIIELQSTRIDQEMRLSRLEAQLADREPEGFFVDLAQWFKWGYKMVTSSLWKELRAIYSRLDGYGVSEPIRSALLVQKVMMETLS